MAAITTQVCDIDGTENAETVTFALNGQTYEIDLSEKSRAALEKAMSKFVNVARTVKASKSVHKSVSNPDAPHIRAWATAQGMEVPARGRLAAELVTAWEAAGSPRA